MPGKFLQYLNSLADENGGFMASGVNKYLGVADGHVSEIAAATYAAEISQTLGVDLPYPEKTAEFILNHQHPDGCFHNLAPLPGVPTTRFNLYNTCVALRGLKAFGKKPVYDPRPWLDKYIRCLEKVGTYHPDFYANSYAVLEDEMKPDCFQKLADFLLAQQDKKSGWLIQPGLEEAGYPIERSIPFNFHAVRFFHLARKRIPKGDEILRGFMKYQESDDSWKLGGVHGTFDACVAIRILGGDLAKYREAIRKAAEWALTCQREDGGFNHFGNKAIDGYIDNAFSEMDACYFHIATLTMAGKLPCKVGFDNNWIGWGHTLMNGKN